MKKALCGMLSLSVLLLGCGTAAAEGAPSGPEGAFFVFAIR